MMSGYVDMFMYFKSRKDFDSEEQRLSYSGYQRITNSKLLMSSIEFDPSFQIEHIHLRFCFVLFFVLVCD